MSLSEIDKKRIEEVGAILTLPDPEDWNRDVISRINDLSDNTLISALERGKKLDFGLRNNEITLTQASLDAAGLHLTVRLAKIFIELATHKSRCVEAPPYRDQRRYGTREGEQAIVDKIRDLHLKGNSYRSIIEILNDERMLPRKGKWNPKTVRAVIENAERGTQRQKCECRMFRTDWVKPRKWSVCWELLRLSDRMFERCWQWRAFSTTRVSTTFEHFAKLG